MTLLARSFFFSFGIVLSCAPASENSSSLSIEEEVNQLQTDEEKTKYLEQILADDQRVRNHEGSELMLKYGQDSPEYMEYVRTLWKQDELNLKKIETFLAIHGYPQEAWGHEATTAPWMVIHHAQGYDVRYRNFEQIYEAFLEGNIE